jgi:hypothetical protein
VILIDANVGNRVGSVLFGMMGMPPTTNIATAFRKGVTATSFTCLTVGYINWPNANSAMWGPGPLRGRSDALGPVVRARCRRSGVWWKHGTADIRTCLLLL